MDDSIPYIASFFEASRQKVWARRELEEVFLDFRESWNLLAVSSFLGFIDLVLSETAMLQIRLGHNYMPVTCYSWGEQPISEVLKIAYPEGYYSHQTAMKLHGLIDNEALTYLNVEQSPKASPRSDLRQDRIDAAFKRPPRLSNNVFECFGQSVCLLSGKSTAQLGVADVKLSQMTMRATGLERTLIDIVVRPSYSGGPSAIVEAYKRALDRLSTNAISDYLDQLAFGYPYHQAIGFYLDRAGAPPEYLDVFRIRERKFDFYLDHQMEDPILCNDWRVYYPNSLYEAH
jgi:hypothetical protein